MAVIKKLKAIKKEQNHLLGIQDLSFPQINEILRQAKTFITLNKSDSKKLDILRGKTQINLFFEPSTRTQSSFELAGKRLGADVMSMNIIHSAIKKDVGKIGVLVSLKTSKKREELKKIIKNKKTYFSKFFRRTNKRINQNFN